VRNTFSAIILIVLALTALGVVTLASSSGVRADFNYNDSYFFLKRQFVWIVAAVLACYATYRVDYHRWRDYAVPMVAAVVLLLVLVRIPHIGTKVNGCWRWLRFGPVSIQPSEFAKFMVIMAVSAWVTHLGPRIRNLKKGLIYPFGGVVIVVLLILAEPDFGTAMLCGVVGGLILFVGGSPWKPLAGAGGVGAVGFGIAIWLNPLRLERVLAFLNPEKYKTGAGYHLIQSLNAFYCGGWHGVGLGNSMQKQFFLPEAHTDFILSIMGEELGFFAPLSVLLLFFALMVCGFIVTVRAPDRYGRLVAFGITMMLTVQAFLNIGVVTGCLPTKGLALPFISYGGSSMVVSLMLIGVLLNIAFQASGCARGGLHGDIARNSAVL
jgi:cell division protein FtsW